MLRTLCLLSESLESLKAFRTESVDIPLESAKSAPCGSLSSLYVTSVLTNGTRPRASANCVLVIRHILDVEVLARQFSYSV